MMEQYFDVGAGIVHVTAPDADVDLSGSALMRFAVAPTAPDMELSLAFAPQLDTPFGAPIFQSPERQVYEDDGGFITMIGDQPTPYLRIQRHGTVSHACFRRDALQGPIHSKQLLRAMEMEHLAAASGSLLFHASFICHNGQAILFTAPSGTGKSTQAELWRRLRGAEILNGDRCIIRSDVGRFLACGVPFSGSSGICVPAKLPLRAIVVLSQAPENTIRTLHGTAAFRSIWEGCSLHTWNRDDVERTVQTASDLISQVPVFHLACTPDHRALQVLEEQLQH